MLISFIFSYNNSPITCLRKIIVLSNRLTSHTLKIKLILIDIKHAISFKHVLMVGVWITLKCLYSFRYIAIVTPGQYAILIKRGRSSLCLQENPDSVLCSHRFTIRKHYNSLRNLPKISQFSKPPPKPRPVLGMKYVEFRMTHGCSAGVQYTWPDAQKTCRTQTQGARYWERKRDNRLPSLS